MPPQASHTPLGWKAIASTVQPSVDSGMMSFGSPSAGFQSHVVPSVRQHEASVPESTVYQWVQHDIADKTNFAQPK